MATGFLVVKGEGRPFCDAAREEERERGRERERERGRERER
jgi:hypothetical protein